VNKTILFLNWSLEPYHTMMRYNKNYENIFKKSESLKDLIEQYYDSDEKISSVEVDN
jgi:uncharacterized protein YdcH (DUF465 family)